LKLSDLCRAGRSPGLPLRVQLPAGELQVKQWLRVLPGRRYVGRADWQGRQVLAKLLVGRRAGLQYRREREGADSLAAQGLNTPELLAADYLPGAGGWLLFDYLQDSGSLGERWLAVAGQPPLSAAQEQVLGVALEAIGSMHAKGLWQEDLHLDNLLCQNNELFWVDGGGIRRVTPSQSLAPESVLANLGVFFAQLPAAFDPFLDELLKYYRRSNPGPISAPSVLQQQIEKVRRWRLKDFLGKIGRDCTLFSVQKGSTRLRAVCRKETELLEPLLADPNHFIAEGEKLKVGGSATVVRLSLGGRQLVVKRYNIKGLGHWLRRCWRPSRAWHSWREAHRLVFLGIATAKPLAILERRTSWLRGRAYLVTEFLDGDNILVRFEPHVNSTPPAEELAALEALFAALTRERISHGDMKGSNLIWHDNGWALIDLDAMRQHRTRNAFARAYTRDRARFLKNWPADSALYRLLDARIPQVSDIFPEQRG